MPTFSSDFINLEEGAVAPDFKLIDVIENDYRTLISLRGIAGTLIVFLCVHCPYVKNIQQKLNELSLKYFKLGITTIGICSNDPEQYPEDSPENLKQFSISSKIPFPILFDATQEIATQYTAVATPDFFLFDRQLSLVYRGCMDDSTPGNGKSVTGAYLEESCSNLLANKLIPKPWKSSIGCSIKWKLSKR